MSRKRKARRIQHAHLCVDTTGRAEAEVITGPMTDFRGRLRPQVNWDRFWGEVEEAFGAYRREARRIVHVQAVRARLATLTKAQQTLSPRVRLATSRHNLEKAIDRSGVMPWEDKEFAALPRVKIGERIAARATADYLTYRAYLGEEEKRLRKHLEALAGRAGGVPRRGRPSAVALARFLDTVRKILKRDLKTPFRWRDLVAVCTYFRPRRLSYQQDPHFTEFLDYAFLHPTPAHLIRVFRRHPAP